MQPNNPDNRCSLRHMPTLAEPPYPGLLAGNKNQAKYAASVLTRKADFEGWSDDELTRALNYYGADKSPPTRKPAPASPEKSFETMDSEEALRLQKRQETVRVTRQADMEGWSDEKLVAALRLRNSIHYELRSRVPHIDTC